MLAIGAVIVCIIAMTTMVISGICGSVNVSFLGTSVLIVMGVIVEAGKMLKAETAAGA